MSELTIKNKSDSRVFRMLPISISNLGREAVIIKEIVARGPGHATYPGVFREPGAAYGIQERVLPKRLEPGATDEFCLFSVAIFRNQIDEVAIVDSDGYEHKLPADNLLRVRDSAMAALADAQPSVAADAPQAAAPLNGSG